MAVKGKLNELKIWNYFCRQLRLWTLHAILLNKIAQLLSRMQFAASIENKKKPCNPPIHEWWNIMNWYLSQFWYIISMQFSLPLFHLVCTLCHERFAEFIFHFFSLSTISNDINVSHFYCCTNRHLFLQYIYEQKKPHFALTMWIFFIIVNRDVDGWNGMSMT